jgi:hypothetical protein
MFIRALARGNPHALAEAFDNRCSNSEQFRRAVVCTENLNTGVVVVKSAQDGA